MDVPIDQLLAAFSNQSTATRYGKCEQHESCKTQ